MGSYISNTNSFIGNALWTQHKHAVVVSVGSSIIGCCSNHSLGDFGWFLK